MSGENGTWYLDISECVSTLEKALKLARERGESALWDVAKAAQLQLLMHTHGRYKTKGEHSDHIIRH